MKRFLDNCDLMGDYFYNVHQKLNGKTLVSFDRQLVLYMIIEKFISFNENLKILEVGTYKGGTAKLICEKLSQSNNFHNFLICDTFTGLPNSTESVDLHKVGDFSDTSKKSVIDYLGNYKNIDINLISGIFPESFPEEYHGIKYDFVHLDVDQYQSYIDCLEFLRPRMNQDSFILCDDYGFASCPGAKKAIDGFCKKYNLEYHKCKTNQAIIIF